MNGETIPIQAYAFIAITTLIMAYVTLTDKEPVPTDGKSATSLLPNLTGAPTTQPSSFPNLNPFAQTTPVKAEPVSSFPNLNPFGPAKPATGSNFPNLNPFGQAAPAKAEPVSSFPNLNPFAPQQAKAVGGKKSKRNRTKNRKTKRRKSS